MNFPYTTYSRYHRTTAKRSNLLLAAKSFWAGMGSVLVLSPPCDYQIYHKKRGPADDYRALQGDCHAVCADLTKETDKQAKRFL